MTILLAIFMAVNMSLSGLALARYNSRTDGITPRNQLEVFWTNTLTTPGWSVSTPTRRKHKKTEKTRASASAEALARCEFRKS